MSTEEIKIEYDKDIEVNESQYNFLTMWFSGSLAHRKENGKYYIRLWVMHHADKIANFLKKK